MSAVPVSPYLADFGPGSDLAAGIATALGARKASNAELAAAAVEKARAEGQESGRAAARAELERKLTEQKAAHEAELARARLAWISQESSKLAERVTLGLRDVETKIADAVSRILHPLLAEQIRQRAIESLRAELDVLLRSGAGVTLQVSGPADLLDGLREQLAGRVESVAFVPGESVDVRISSGDTVLETRLGAWLDGIREATR